MAPANTLHWGSGRLCSTNANTVSDTDDGGTVCRWAKTEDTLPYRSGIATPNGANMPQLWNY